MSCPPFLRMALGALWLPMAAAAALAEAPLSAQSANEIAFPPRPARFVRLAIFSTSGGQPCLDELEVFGPEGGQSLALAAGGARPSASSTLAGYEYHKVEHLNDGQYGNMHSWIAASSDDQWAQIELPAAVRIAKVVISRDRGGHYRDRMPLVFEVRLSLDGQQWQTVRRIESAGAAAARPNLYTPPVPLPQVSTYDALLRYALLTERATWQRLPAADHLSPLQVERPATPGGSPYWGRLARLDPLARTLLQLEQMIERLGAKGAAVDEARAVAADFRRRLVAAPADAATGERLYLELRLAKRRLMFADPDLAALERILFIKRHPYLPSHNYSDILDSQFLPGGGVCLLEIPRPLGRLEPARARLTTLFDASAGIARDAASDFDGARIYFAYRPGGKASGGDKYWRLMTMETGGQPRQLGGGPFHDYYPCPLPDGGLAFISTRCRSRFLCWRPQAFVLFRMDERGGDIRPLSYANLSEWGPTVMRDGRVLWTRSEYIDKGADFGHTLWAIRPDGTHPELIYGNDTPNCYMNGREIPGSGELCCTLISHGGDLNGPIALIDRAKGPFDPAAITNITPDVKPHYNMSWARQECFRDPQPLARDYFLVSHAAADRFGLYVIDRYGNRELLYLDPLIASVCPTPLAPRPRPPVLPPDDPLQADAASGQFFVADVYRGLGATVPRGTVKYLRVCEEVRPELEQLPNGEFRNDHNPFQDFYATPIHKVSGPAGWPSYVAKAALGLVPVAADGSASFRAPAGKVLYFQLLDEEFTEIQRMRSVVQLQPGETRSCIGCHEDRHTAPPVAAGGGAFAAATPLKTPPWGDEPFSYEKVVQGVWDARCAGCHRGGNQGQIDLTGTLDQDRVPASYRTLVAGGWVHYFDCRYQLRHTKAPPLSFGTAQSRLWRVLQAGHYGVRLTSEEAQRVKCWIDLNCPLWPDYTYRPLRPAKATPPLAAR